MLKCDQPERPKKVYIIPKQSKKRLKEISEGSYKPKQQKPIKPRSDKRAKQYKLYGPIQKQFLIDNPICQAKIKCHGAPATEVHHGAGKTEWLLIDIQYFVAICRDCHNWELANSKAAKDAGISVLRSNKTTKN